MRYAQIHRPPSPKQNLYYRKVKLDVARKYQICPPSAPRLPFILPKKHLDRDFREGRSAKKRFLRLNGSRLPSTKRKNKSIKPFTQDAFARKCKFLFQFQQKQIGPPRPSLKKNYHFQKKIKCGKARIDSQIFIQ